MTHFNRFIIHNEFSGKLLVAVEPEGAVTFLESGGEIHVSERFNEQPITLNVSISDEGLPQVAIWPGDGTLRVQKDGVDLRELE